MKRSSALHGAFSQGLIDGLPICLGYLSVGFAFGIFAVESGLSVLEALLISMTNVTSAGQLAGVPIIASGTLIEMAVTQLVINLRYALMSVSVSQKYDSSMTPLHRAVTAFVLTDEVFGVASAKKGLLGRTYLYGLIIPPFLGWSSGTLLGALAGHILPAIVVTALGIAIYGMFIAIVVPEMRQSRAMVLCVALSVAASCLFAFTPVLRNIPDGFVIILCSVAVACVCALVAPVPAEEGGEGDA